MVKVTPGFCFSAVALDGATKAVVNICGHDSVGVPLAKNMSPVDESYIDERGLDNLIIPISVSPPVQLPADVDYNYCVDVVVHTCLTKRCVEQHHFFNHYVARLIELGLEWVKQECGLVLAHKSCTFLGSHYYGKGSEGTEAESPEDLLKMADQVLNALKSTGDNQMRSGEAADGPTIPADLTVNLTRSGSAGKGGKLLVQEVVTTPGIKKGFLLGGGVRLYDDKGSAEGEGKSPDPLAHIPQSFRDKCKIIDTRNMDTASVQEAIRKHEERQEMASPAVPPSPVPSTNPEPLTGTAAAAAATGQVERWRLESVSTSADAAVIRVLTDEALKGVSDVDLTVTETEVNIDGFRYILPRPVDEDSVKAKYIKSSRTLVLVCPFR